MMVLLNVVVSCVFLVMVSNIYTSCEPALLTQHNIRCIADTNCTAHAYCSNTGECICNEGYTTYRQLDIPGKKAYHVLCLREAIYFGDHCIKDIQCKAPFGTLAYCNIFKPHQLVGQCECLEGSHFKEKECYKSSLIGEICNDPENCVIKSRNLKAYCEFSHCICPPKHHPTPDGTDCHELSDLGDPCLYDSACPKLNSECKYGHCRCKKSYIPNLKKDDCLLLAEKLDDPCEEEEQCTVLQPNTRCDESKGVCVCQNGTHIVSGSCWKSAALLKPCDTTFECLVDKSFVGVTCKSGICQCKDGYYLEEQTTCLKDNTTQLSSGAPSSISLVLVYGILSLMNIHHII